MNAALCSIVLLAMSGASAQKPTLSDLWFNTLWDFMGPLTDKGFAKPKKELFGAVALSGKVLEIGPGHGSTLPHIAKYIGDGSIKEYVFFEPNTAMHDRLHDAARNASLKQLGTPQYSILASSGALQPADFDAVISSLVLCSVDDLEASVKDLYRWLKPGGHLLFLEHVLDGQQESAAQCSAGHQRLAEGHSHAPIPTWKARLQRWITPAWRYTCGNCHLDRPTVDAIRSVFDEVDVLGITGKVIPFVYGTARKKA